MTTTETPLRERLATAWRSGDYTQISKIVASLGDVLCEAIDLIPGSRVLDVACGDGNASLAAARRFCEVTGVDIGPAWVERARERAAAERLDATFLEGDAHALPVPDESFDVVMSCIGAMFAADHEQVARELVRACRPGGVIGMLNWTASGVLTDMFATMGKYVPPAPGARPPTLWGDEDHVRALFGDAVTDVQVTPGVHTVRLPSVRVWRELHANYYGPFVRALAALDDDGKEALLTDLEAVIAGYCRPGVDAAIYDSSYVIVRAIRR